MEYNHRGTNVKHLERFDRTSICLFGIIFFGFIARLYYLNRITVRGDEIAYFYDSYLITKGKVPLVDYHARTPIYLYFVSIFIRVFGNSIEAARISSLIASTLTIPFLFILVRKLFNPEVALISTAIFAFSPFSIKYGIMLVPEVILTLMFIIVMILIVDGTRAGNQRNIIIAGIVMGLSIYFRRTAGLSLVIIPFSILAYHFLRENKEENTILRTLERSIKKAFLPSIKFFLAFLVGFMPIFMLLAHGTSWEYMISNYKGSSAGEGVELYPLPNYIIQSKWFSYRSFFTLALFLGFILQHIMRNEKSRIIRYPVTIALSYWLYFHISSFNEMDYLDEGVAILFLFLAIPLSWFSRIMASRKARGLYLLTIFLLLFGLIAIQLDEYSRLQNNMVDLLVFIGVMCGILFGTELLHRIWNEIVFGKRTATGKLGEQSTEIGKLGERSTEIGKLGEQSTETGTTLIGAGGQGGGVVATSLHVIDQLVEFILEILTLLIELLPKPIRRILERPLIPFILSNLAVLTLVGYLLWTEDNILLAQEKFLLNIIYIGSVGIILYLVKFMGRFRMEWGDLMIIVWFATVFLFYSNYGQFLDFYYYEIMVPLSVGAGVAVVRFHGIVPEPGRKAFHILISLLLVSVLVSNSFNLGMNERSAMTDLPTPENIRQVSNYLETLTEPGDIIFTASLAVVVSADLRVPMDVSHPFYYHSPELYISKDLLRYPSLNELKDYLLENRIKYAVVDYGTELDYFLNNSEFREFFFSNYLKIKEIGVMSIYQLNDHYAEEE